MGKHQTAERAGTERAEDLTPTIQAVPAYGSGNGSWRERHQPIYRTDAQLRWAIDEHRAELMAAGALALFKNRLFCIEPAFSEAMLRIGRERLSNRPAELQRGAQAAADAFVAGRARLGDPADDAQVEALQQVLP